MAQEDVCDCERIPPLLAPLRVDCERLNFAVRQLGGVISPPSGNGAAPSALPQPLRVELELIERCELEDPDDRPYIWECDETC